MFLRAGVILMSLALMLVVATVALAGAREDYEQAASVRPLPPPVPAAQTVEEPEDYSQPWLNIPDPKSQTKSRPEPEPRPEPRKPEPKPEAKPVPKPELKPEPKPEPKPESKPEPKSEPEPEPEPEPEKQAQPADARDRKISENDGPKRFGARRHDLPSWAKMDLTVPALGIRDAPVRSSDNQAALDAGVVHVPGTSLPWDAGSRRNVYLAGHRLGWPGTGSNHIFYRLPELRRGDQVMLRDGRGRAYRYRVTEKILVDPEATWATRGVPGRDLLSLQTCTPIPTFHKRLIVRAERIEDHSKKPDNKVEAAARREK